MDLNLPNFCYIIVDTKGEFIHDTYRIEAKTLHETNKHVFASLCVNNQKVIGVGRVS